MKLLLFLFFLIESQAQISGIVKDTETGDDLQNVEIVNLNSKLKVYSNKYGFFRIGGQVGDIIQFHKVGYLDSTIIIPEELSSEILKVELIRKQIALNELVVSGKSESIIDLNEVGKITLTAGQVKEIPMILGEKDPIRALQFLPGFQDVKEGSAGLSVRGGSSGQNLLILDEAVVYNANHLFGFFSTFNNDAILSISAYKTAFPAQYGGRVSSIIDLKMKEGNTSKITINGGIGLISSRLMIEGPILKNKVSFLFSGRRTYADYLIRPFQAKTEKTLYYFYDFNAKFKFDLDTKNQFYISFYNGDDHFKQINKIPRQAGTLFNSTGLSWGNLTVTSRWNKIYNSKTFQNLSLIYSNYKMNLYTNTTQDYLNPPRFSDISFSSQLQNFCVKLDYDKFFNNNQVLKYGLQSSYYQFNSREFYYKSNNVSDDFQENALPSSNFENIAYIDFKKNFRKAYFNIGLRAVTFNNLTTPKIEPRSALSFQPTSNQSISFSYSRMNQYLHLISNTGNGLPTDTWIPSSDFLKPILADHFNLNYSKSFKSSINFSFDVYYKLISGNTDFKKGSQFLSFNQKTNNTFKWEDNLTQGRAWNYGYEFFIHKKGGKFSGFAGYTLAWSISKFKDLNDGKPFFNTFDRRHIIEATFKFQKNQKISIFSNFTYTSGNAISLPSSVVFNSDKGRDYLEYIPGLNTFRTEPYHRLDVGFTLNPRGKNNYWEFSLYNAYNRKNPYNYDLKQYINKEKGTFYVVNNRQWLFPIIPSITYNFKFK